MDGIKENMECELDFCDLSELFPGCFNGASIDVDFPNGDEADVSLSYLFRMYNAKQISVPQAIDLAIKEIHAYIDEDIKEAEDVFLKQIIRYGGKDILKKKI